MKITAAILAALSVAVLSSCTKSDNTPTTDKTSAVDTSMHTPGANSPDYCPACGMG